MRHVPLISFMVFVALGLTGCIESGPKVGGPPESSPSATAVAQPAPSTNQADTVDQQGSVEQGADEQTADERGSDAELLEGQTMVSHKGSYQMTAFGQWNIERGSEDFPSYPEGEVDDPAEMWAITHPEVEMRGEIFFGMQTAQTAPRAITVLDALTEERLPALDSHYGNAYLIEGFMESAGEEFYRLGLVTDHGSVESVLEAHEYFGNRTPAPRFFFVMHSISAQEFEQYKQSQARQDLLEMFRSLHIEDPESFAEGVDLENSDLFQHHE